MTESRPDAKLYITEEEHVKLLYAANGGQTLLTAFGVGRVWLEKVQTNDWAFKLLVKWRGLNT